MFDRLWGRVGAEPIFVMTGDQDWTPEWAAQRWLDKLAHWNIPGHIFRTNPSALMESAVKRGDLEQGWHPNFLPGSTHGSTVDEVVSYCQKNFSGARTARMHCFAEDSFRMKALAKAGIVADSQNPTACQGYLMPMVHPSGILRLPVYFEDDVAFDAVGEFTIDTFRKTLFTPGLKIFNFHPTFLACNTPSQAHYNSTRGKFFGTSQPSDGVIYKGRGTATMLDDLADEILSAGYKFESFHGLVDELRIAKDRPELSPQGSILSFS